MALKLTVLALAWGLAIAEWTDGNKQGFRVLPEWGDFPDWLDSGR